MIEGESIFLNVAQTFKDSNRLKYTFLDKLQVYGRFLRNFPKLHDIELNNSGAFVEF